jgi:hypothetical protein
MNKQLKSKQKHKILNVKNHKIFNYSKLTKVHEWLLVQSRYSCILQGFLYTQFLPHFLLKRLAISVLHPKIFPN